jgi:hypothetical protein
MLFRRWLLLLVLAALVPGTSDLIGEAVSLATDAACCADADCEHALGHGCGQECAHCGWCAHSNAVPGASWGLLARAPVAGVARVGQVSGRYRPGYRAPPFRPPLAA